jgi:lipoyl(octanoyl) transferase
MNVSASWLLLQSGPAGAAENMALDETLLHAAPELRGPVLRFYSWSEPAASFGYFQKFSDVQAMTNLRPLIRRPTAGGLVPHESDWTYSLIFPPTHSWYELKALESYRRLHQWLQAAFARAGVETMLAMSAQKQAPGQCFAGPDQFDLLWSGSKIAGAAQRRTRTGLLVQGSVQPPAGLAREDWQRAICAVPSAHWHVRWREWTPPALLQERTAKLASEKYASAAYNQRR